jgi:putative peptide zinc metalloprotease protein
MDAPRLRPELAFSFRNDGVGVLIEDPISGGFLETDRETAAFARLLDGSRTPEAAFSQLLADSPGATLRPQEIPLVLDELSRNGMLEGSQPGAMRTAGRRFGMVSQRLRLGAWDDLFAWLAGHLGWLYGPIAWVAWFLLLVVAGSELVGQWGTFTTELGQLFSIDAILWFWLAWVVSKAWHEFQHGIVARLYGVEVREIGLMFTLFMPLGAYVDVTGVWRLDSRLQRLHITAAGIIGELGLGALAIILWSRAPEGEWRSFLQALIVATTLSTVVFNANPLMRYDGYHAVVDIFRLPNLYQRGLAAVRAMSIRIISGVKVEGEGGAVLLYGWSALAWRLLIASGLTVAAAHFAFGFGVVLGVLVLWNMFAVPLGRLAQAIWRIGPKARRQSGLRLGLACLVLGGLWFLPIPIRVSAPGVVAYRGSVEVRAAAPGEVVEVKVTEGDRVTAGQAMVRIANPALLAERDRLAAKLARTGIELTKSRNDGDPTAAQDAEDRLKAVQEELNDAEFRLRALEVAAPRDGVVLGDDIAALTNRWVERGELIAEVADTSSLEAQVWLLPEDVASLSDAVAAGNFHPAVFGAAAVPVQLQRIEPVATTVLPPDPITARGGGFLPINVHGQKPRLVNARLKAIYIPLDAKGYWQPGVPGQIMFAIKTTSVGSIIVRFITDKSLRNLFL